MQVNGCNQQCDQLFTSRQHRESCTHSVHQSEISLQRGANYLKLPICIRRLRRPIPPSRGVLPHTLKLSPAWHTYTTNKPTQSLVIGAQLHPPRVSTRITCPQIHSVLTAQLTVQSCEHVHDCGQRMLMAEEAACLVCHGKSPLITFDRAVQGGFGLWSCVLPLGMRCIVSSMH
jgi:hypothetical protein